MQFCRNTRVFLQNHPAHPPLPLPLSRDAEVAAAAGAARRLSAPPRSDRSRARAPPPPPLPPRRRSVAEMLDGHGRSAGERAASERRGGKWAARFRGGGRTHATARSWRVEIAAYLDLILSDDQPKTASSSPRTNSPPPLATILSSGEKFVLLPLPSNRSSSSTSRSASSAQGFGSNLVTLPLLRASGCHQGMLPLPSPSLLLSSLPPHACAMFLLFFILSVASSTSRIHPC